VAHLLECDFYNSFHHIQNCIQYRACLGQPMRMTEDWRLYIAQPILPAIGTHALEKRYCPYRFALYELAAIELVGSLMTESE